MAKLPRIPKIPKIKTIRPPKPIDRVQNIKSMPKLGQSESVTGHWRYDERGRKWVWVKAHFRKP